MTTHGATARQSARVTLRLAWAMRHDRWRWLYLALPIVAVLPAIPGTLMAPVLLMALLFLPYPLRIYGALPTSCVHRGRAVVISRALFVPGCVLLAGCFYGLFLPAHNLPRWALLAMPLALALGLSGTACAGLMFRLDVHSRLQAALRIAALVLQLALYYGAASAWHRGMMSNLMRRDLPSSWYHGSSLWVALCGAMGVWLLWRAWRAAPDLGSLPGPVAGRHEADAGKPLRYDRSFPGLKLHSTADTIGKFVLLCGVSILATKWAWFTDLTRGPHQEAVTATVVHLVVTLLAMGLCESSFSRIDIRALRALPMGAARFRLHVLRASDFVPVLPGLFVPPFLLMPWAYALLCVGMVLAVLTGLFLVMAKQAGALEESRRTRWLLVGGACLTAILVISTLRMDVDRALAIMAPYGVTTASLSFLFLWSALGQGRATPRGEQGMGV